MYLRSTEGLCDIQEYSSTQESYSYSLNTACSKHRVEGEEVPLRYYVPRCRVPRYVAVVIRVM